MDAEIRETEGRDRPSGAINDNAAIIASMEPLIRLNRDIKAAVATLTPAEARYLVDLYYLIQEDRKRLDNQEQAMDRSSEPEPHTVLNWFSTNVETLENDLRRALDIYSAGQVPGRWARSIVGIGPVIAAGLLAHIDVEKAPTVGHIWRFAGLDPTTIWLGKEKAAALVRDVTKESGGKLTAAAVMEAATRANRKLENLSKSAEDLARKAAKAGPDEEVEITNKSLSAALAKRPWSAGLKVLCWKIGESFVKVSGNEADVYGKVYLTRKAEEIERNERLEYADQAAYALATKRIDHGTEAYKAYSVGKLPPAHIHSRAKRYAVKLFLAHYHHVAYEERFGTPPPLPYIIQHGGHVHFIAPPNWPVAESRKAA